MIATIAAFRSNMPSGSGQSIDSVHVIGFSFKWSVASRLHSNPLPMPGRQP